MKSFESTPSPYSLFYNPDTDQWSTIWPSISKLEDDCFPGKGLGEEYLQGVFEDPNNLIVLLKSGSEIIGFSCGIPDKENPDTLYIETTEITPSQQSKGLVSQLMTKLEDEARRRGFLFITRDAEIANGYADKIVKNYSDRIIESHDHESEYSMGGMQRFFKIAL